MGVKIFSTQLSVSEGIRRTTLGALASQMSQWQDEEAKEQGSPLKNVVLSQSLTADEIIIIVWYD